MSLTLIIIVAFLGANEAVEALAPVHGIIPGGRPREAPRIREAIVERAGESLRTLTNYGNLLSIPRL